MNDESIQRQCFPLIREIILAESPGPDRPLLGHDIAQFLLAHPDAPLELIQYVGPLGSPERYAHNIVSWYGKAWTHHSRTELSPEEMAWIVPNFKGIQRWRRTDKSRWLYWPGTEEPNADDEALLEAISPAKAARSRGQGHLLTYEQRRAVELHAMRITDENFRRQGWTVRDVSANQSYDLHCSRAGETLRVEVKGTIGRGETIDLTRNEVQLAQSDPAHSALAIVSNIDLNPDTNETTGGTFSLHLPWHIDDAQLVPTAYRYTVTRDPRTVPCEP